MLSLARTLDAHLSDLVGGEVEGSSADAVNKAGADGRGEFFRGHVPILSARGAPLP